MADRDHWDRRRFLALAGGTTILAGCAAEPIEEGETDSPPEGDGNEESNDTEEEQEDNPDENETTTNGNESESDEDNSTKSDTEGELGNESEEGDEGGEGTETSENSSTEEETPTEGTGEETATEEETETPAEEETPTEEQTEDETPTEEETATEEDENTEEEDTPSEPPLSDISIRVVGPAGEPIEGATVTGEGEPHEADIPLEFDGETNSDGVHENQIYQNEYTIEVNHPDYETTTVEHTHDGESELEVELETVVETFPITIRVTDSEGEPIEGASISGQGDPYGVDIPLEFSGETDSNGEYTDVIYANEYHIEVDHPDYSSDGVEYTHTRESEVVISLSSVEDDSTEEPTEASDDSTEEPTEASDDSTEEPTEENTDSTENPPEDNEGEPEITEYEIVDDGRGYAMVEGVVANNSEEDLATVTVEVWFYNAEDQQIGNSRDGMTSLSSGNEWPFEIATAVEMKELEDHEIELDYRLYR